MSLFIWNVFLNVKIAESDAKLAMLMRVWLCSLFDTFSVVNVITGQVWKSVLDQLFPALEFQRDAAQGAPLHQTLQVCRNSDLTNKIIIVEVKMMFFLSAKGPKRLKAFQGFDIIKAKMKCEPAFTCESNQTLLDASSEQLSATSMQISKYPAESQFLRGFGSAANWSCVTSPASLTFTASKCQTRSQPR